MKNVLKVLSASLLLGSTVALASCDFSTGGSNIIDVVNQKTTITIIAKSTDSKVNSTAVQNTKIGASFILPTPEVEGYDFVGWYSDELFMFPTKDTFTVSGDTTVYAKLVSKKDSSDTPNIPDTPESPDDENSGTTNTPTIPSTKDDTVIVPRLDVSQKEKLNISEEISFTNTQNVNISKDDVDSEEGFTLNTESPIVNDIEISISLPYTDGVYSGKYTLKESCAIETYLNFDQEVCNFHTESVVEATTVILTNESDSTKTRSFKISSVSILSTYSNENFRAVRYDIDDGSELYSIEKIYKENYNKIYGDFDYDFKGQDCNFSSSYESREINTTSTLNYLETAYSLAPEIYGCEFDIDGTLTSITETWKIASF